MNKAFGGAALLLVIAGALASMHAPAHDDVRTPAVQAPKNQEPPVPETKEEKPKSDAEVLIQKIKMEASLVGATTDHPADDQKRLKDLALSLTPDRLVKLKDIVLDLNEDPDSRFLSAYVLSESELADAVPLLTEIALAPITGQDRQLNFESTIRMQAIDGIINNPNKEIAVKGLKSVRTKTDQSLFADRSQRGLLYREGLVPSPAQQETTALKKLIRN